MAAIEVSTGNEELDKKVEQWLHWDKVREMLGIECKISAKWTVKAPKSLH